MSGMELSDDPKKNEPGIHMRVLRVLLTASAHVLLPSFEQAISERIDQELLFVPENVAGQ